MKPLIVVGNYVNHIPARSPKDEPVVVNRELFKVRRLVAGEAQIGIIDLGEDEGYMPDIVPVPHYEDVIPKGQHHPYMNSEEEANSFAASLKV